MAQGQIGSGLQQLNISGVEQQQASGLAQDIGNLFGSVAKGVETYNTIGVNAAKLDINDRMNEARLKITAINESISGNPDDPNVYNQAIEAIDGITAELVADRDKYKNHRDAYDEYDKQATDFSVGIKSKMYPSFRASQFEALKTTFDRNKKNEQELARKSNVPFNKSQVESTFSESSVYNLDPLMYTGKAFDTNFHIANGEFTQNPMKFIKDNGILQVDEKTKTLMVNHSNFEKAITNYLGSHIKYENGKIVSGSEFTTQEEVDRASQFAGLLLKTVSADGKKGKHPMVDVWLKEANRVLDDTKDPKILGSIESFENLKKVPKDEMNDAQIEATSEFFSTVDIRTNNWERATPLLINALNSKDVASIRQWTSNGSSKYKLGGADFNVVLSNIHEKNEFNINTAMQSGDLNAVRGIALMQAGIKTATGVDSQAIKDSESILFGQSLPLTTNQILSSITIQRAMLEVNPNAVTSSSSGESTSINKEWLSQLENSVIKASVKAKELYPNDANARFGYVKTEFMSARTQGKTNYGSMILENKSTLSNFDVSELDATFTNLGTHVRLDNGLKGYMAHVLSKKGISLKGKSASDMSGIMKDELYRVSNFYGKAVSFPQMSSNGKPFEDKDYMKLAQYTLMENNLSPMEINADNINVYVRMSPKNEPMVLVGIVTTSGKELKPSSYLLADSISQLKVNKEYGIKFAPMIVGGKNILTGKKQSSDIGKEKKKAEGNIAKIKADIERKNKGK